MNPLTNDGSYICVHHFTSISPGSTFALHIPWAAVHLLHRLNREWEPQRELSFDSSTDHTESRSRKILAFVLSNLDKLVSGSNFCSPHVSTCWAVKQFLSFNNSSFNNLPINSRCRNIFSLPGGGAELAFLTWADRYLSKRQEVSTLSEVFPTGQLWDRCFSPFICLFWSVPSMGRVFCFCCFADKTQHFPLNLILNKY